MSRIDEIKERAEHPMVFFFREVTSPEFKEALANYSLQNADDIGYLLSEVARLEAEVAALKAEFIRAVWPPPDSAR